MQRYISWRVDKLWLFCKETTLSPSVPLPWSPWWVWNVEELQAWKIQPRTSSFEQNLFGLHLQEVQEKIQIQFLVWSVATKWRDFFYRWTVTCLLKHHKTQPCSPNSEVLKRSCEYFLILSLKKISWVPLLLAVANSNVSPMTGHPFLSGGNLAWLDFCLYIRNMREIEIQRITRWSKFGRKSIPTSTITAMSKTWKGDDGQTLASLARIYIGKEECLHFLESEISEKEGRTSYGPFGYYLFWWKLKTENIVVK